MESQQSPESPYLLLVFGFGAKENGMTQQENLLRPWLNIAVICEKILREADGAVSVIRMIDRFNFAGAAKDMGPQVMRFTVLIMFRAGILRGKQRIHLRPHSPTG